MEQQMARNDLPGFGDQATWPACTGHPGDPRTDPDDNALSEELALEIAEDENERTPCHFAAWLYDAADNPHLDRAPADLAALRERLDDGEPLTAGQCVALIVAGTDADALRAVHIVRGLFRAAPVSKEWSEGRAKELLAAQEEQEETLRIEALAEIYAEAA
jgi:hypothetical protein